MEKYILDTNLFFNMEAGIGFGINTQEVVESVTEIAKKLKEEQKGIFFMSPRTVEEFLSFFEDKKQEFIENFLASVIIKSPEVGSINLPAQIFYHLVDDIRQRSYRGLTIGEEEIKKTGEQMMGKKELVKKDFEIQVGSFIKKYRDRYRNATRTGFLDSLADLDCIMLAKEQDAFLVSTDEGVLKWARLFGVKELPAVVWKKQLNDLLRVHSHQE